MSWVFRRPTDYRAKSTALFALLAAASATSGTAAIAFSTAGAITGIGQLAGTASLAFDATAAHSAGGTLAGSIDLQTDATGTILGSGQLAGAADLTFSTSAVPSSSAAFGHALYQKRRAIWEPARFDYTQANRLAIFPYSAASGISGQADISFGNTSGVLTGIAAITGTTGIVITPTGVILGQGALAGPVTLTLVAEGALSGTASGSVSGLVALSLTSTGDLVGAGALIGTSAITFVAELTPGSIQQIAGSSDIVFSLAGSIFDLPEFIAPPPDGRMHRAKRRNRTYRV